MHRMTLIVLFWTNMEKLNCNSVAVTHFLVTLNLIQQTAITSVLAARNHLKPFGAFSVTFEQTTILKKAIALLG